MKKRAFLGMLALTLGLVGIPAPTVLAGDYRCTEAKAPPPVVDDLVVPPGAYCLAFGTLVTGNLKLEPGAEGIFGMGLRIRGNLDGDGFQSVSISSSRIDGNVLLKKGSYVFFDNSFFGENSGLGNVQLEEITSEIDLYLDNRTEGGGNWIEGGGNWIGGNLKLAKNSGSSDISNNTIRQNLQVFENTGPTVIAGNRVGQDLQCEKNTPPPTGGGNTAKKKEGQCTAL